MTGLGSSCGACKFLRRRCTNECVFAPYFCYEQGATHFAAVHKVFGASNVSKLLLHLPLQSQSEATITISYEALARMRDPIYGCVAHIFALQQQVANLQEEIELLGTQIATLMTNVPICQSSQETNKPNNGFHFPSQLDAIDIHYGLNQEATFSFDTEISATSNLVLENEMNLEFPPLYNNNLGDPIFVCDTEPNPLERLPEGISQEFFNGDLWLDNGSYAEYQCESAFLV